MDARRAILAALPGQAPPRPPAWGGPTIRFADPGAAFRGALEAAGGRLVVSDRDPDEPFLCGGPAVAECGAVWWVPRDAAERREAFLAERMVLRVARADLVHDLHAAYARIGPALAEASFGCFVSGPSKTADIEQALVIGAHGPRALEVWLV